MSIGVFPIITTDGSTGGGISTIDIRPADMRLDDTETGSDRGTIWNIISSVDFDPTTDGAIWFSFNFPENWEIDQDINLSAQYSCDGSDPAKDIILNIKTWAISPDSTPASASPGNTNNETITTSATNIDKLTTVDFANGKVDASQLSSTTNTIVIKVTRDADNASDTYTGTFQLIAIQAKQS